MFRRAAIAIVFALLVAACSGGAAEPTTDEPPARPSPLSTAEASRRAVARACELDPTLLARIWRGHDERRSEDVTWVPAEPNYWGTFDVQPHSGPWDYLQEVPLVLYGPGRIANSGSVERPVTLADVYPTVESLLDARFDPRAGSPLVEALEPDADGAPKLIVSLMWDGVGDNVLDRWPDSYPTLARLMAEGTHYTNATVGSSPSMTPATHATFSTGTFPNEHRLVQIVYRGDDGSMTTSFRERDPRDLKRSTFADQHDKATGNKAKVGLLAWRDWHMPMMSKGSAPKGGDRDHLALIARDGRATGNRNFYKTPAYMKSKGSALARYLEEQDRADGKADGQLAGHGHGLDEYEDTPAWVRFQADLNIELLRRAGYGRDRVPDLFFANYKATDIAGHQHSLDSDEMREALEAQDRQLGRLIRWLDRRVKDHVVILTADHGHTPAPRPAGAWPIGPGKARRDLDKAFGVPEGKSLMERTTVVGPYFDRAVMRSVDATPREIARFFADYTIRDSWGSKPLPKGYEGRGDELVMSAVWAKADFPDIMACAFPDSDGIPPQEPSPGASAGE